MHDLLNHPTVPLLLCALVLFVLAALWTLFQESLELPGADVLRAWPLLLLFLLTFGVVLALNPAKAGLTLFGISKLALGGYLGYWCDRLAFRPGDRPHLLDTVNRGTAWKRRALIMAAAILAAALIP